MYEPSSNLRHVSQYARSKEKIEMHVHIVNGIDFQA
jgi:sRNA-binding regulator protein Hfq